MMTSQAKSPGAHIDVFDGLRALAIIMVVWLHTWQLSWMSNTLTIGSVTLTWAQIPETGFLGVELFFFVSGFCLFYPYARSTYEGTAPPTLRGYVYRRAIKILPSYWLACALLLVSTSPSFGSPAAWAWQLGTHALFIHNWFPECRDTINGVFWSLGVEVQFYVLFPFIAWFFRRYSAATFVTMMWIGSEWRHAVALHVETGAQAFWQSELPGYLDLFACGMLAASLLVRWRGFPAYTGQKFRMTFGSVLAFYALGALLQSVYVVRYSQHNWPVDWQVEHRTLVALTFLAIALTSAGATPLWRWQFSNRVVLFLSTISYNLYIWHQVIARYLADHRIPAPATQDPHLDPTWEWHYMLLALGLSLAFSTLVTYGIERPLLKHGPRGCLNRLKALVTSPKREFPLESKVG